MQQTIFSILKEDYKIKKPIRLIEMFGGIGSQSAALRNLSKDFVNYKLIEIDNYCILSYNAIHGTNFQPQDITKIKGEDLEIVEKDKYEYVLTYSFPCTDVSLAGKRLGMAKDSGTRSALLWEVERIMKELKELNQLPQILLMENVPQVINNDFNKWQSFLESIGYSNYTEILNAKDYGIPQNRNRCFMVSILGDYNYLFPPKQKLELRLKDLLEDEVDEKYYINNEKAQKLIDDLISSGKIANRTEQNRTDKFCVDGTINNPNTREVANCIKARYDAGISNLRSDGNMVVEQSRD